MKRYLAIVAISPLLLITLILIFIYFFNGAMPAPRISSSESFNEKARWLKTNLNNGCDIVIVGSSMALNNVDGSTIKSNFPSYSVINIASWGLNISESRQLLLQVTKKCKPKLIIYSAYYADFDSQWSKDVDWELLENYFDNEPVILTYLKSLDIRYYISTFFSRKVAQRKLNQVYHSLFFDETGSILLDCDNFDVIPARWTGHKKYKALNIKNIESNILDLKNIQDYINKNSIHFIFIKTPLRLEANETLSKPEIEQLWIDVEKSIKYFGGRFIDMQLQNGFTDDLFTDFAHLNKCGARKEIKFVIPVLRNLMPE